MRQRSRRSRPAGAYHAFAYNGAACGLLKLKSSDISPRFHGTLMQAADATAFRGKQIGFSAYLKESERHAPRSGL